MPLSRKELCICSISYYLTLVASNNKNHFIIICKNPRGCLVLPRQFHLGSFPQLLPDDAGTGAVLKTPSLTSLVVDVGCWPGLSGPFRQHLNMASPCVQGFLEAWQLSSKGKPQEGCAWCFYDLASEVT